MKWVVVSLRAHHQVTDGQSEFDVLVDVDIGEGACPGSEVFQLRVVSPSVLAETGSGDFVLHTLVLDVYSEDALRARIDKLLLHCASVDDWSGLIQSLIGYLRHVP